MLLNLEFGKGLEKAEQTDLISSELFGSPPVCTYVTSLLSRYLSRFLPRVRVSPGSRAPVTPFFN